MPADFLPVGVVESTDEPTPLLMLEKSTKGMSHCVSTTSLFVDDAVGEPDSSEDDSEREVEGRTSEGWVDDWPVEDVDGRAALPATLREKLRRTDDFVELTDS